MFHKEGSYSTTQGKKTKDTPLRKSDRRKLRDKFLSILLSQETEGTPNTSIHQEEEEATTQFLSHVFLDSNSEISLRKIRLPNAKSNAGATHVYIRTPTSRSKPPSLVGETGTSDGDYTGWPYTHAPQAILLEFDQHLLPTCALLSTLPPNLTSRLPTLTIPPQVSRYICRGADLMRSGMFSLPDRNRIPRNGWVCIAVENNTQPFAIGFLTNGTDVGTIGVGAKGVGVSIVTCYGDDLWRNQMSSTTGAHGQKDGTDKGYRSDMGGSFFSDGHYGNIGFVDGKCIYGLKYETEETGVGSEQDNDEQNLVQGMTQTSLQTDEEQNDDQTEESDQEEQVNEEEIAESNLLYAFQTSILQLSLKKDLPIAVSNYYAQHLLSARKEGTTIDLKATRYKRIGSFLLGQAQLGVIQIGSSKDGKDPIAFVTGVDRMHGSLREARKRRKEALEKNGGNEERKESKKKMGVVTLYIIPPHVASLLQLDQDLVKALHAKSEQRRGTGFLTMPECREILNGYIVKNELIDEYDPEMVKLDGPLTDVLFRRTKKEVAASRGAPAHYPEDITRKELNEKWLGKLDFGYAIVSMPGSIIVNMKRGTPAKVSFEVEARQNRKKFITRVRGLEEYGINGPEFANDVAKRFACSATVEENPVGRAALKKGNVELVFQGHLVEELQALLTGNSKMTSHGGVKGSGYSIPKNVFEVNLRKGVPKKKR